MSGFKALNIESDDESDIEVDDTKEIQIEEALKLYQNALKYHSEGPESYDKAADAYQQLFDSEIFKYPESQLELQRIEIYGPLTDAEDVWDDLLPGDSGVVTNLDTGPSTLPQILHLSHKNYAQFKLDALAARFDIFSVTLSQILVDAKSALDHFVHALDKDENDSDLWRRTASVGEMLDSRRVARFCLEAVLDSDTDGFNAFASLPGLEEGFAGEQLRELVTQLQDQLSLMQAPLCTTKRKALSKYLKQQLHHYDGILKHENEIRKEEHTPREPTFPDRVFLKAPTTWAELGDALLRQLAAEQHGTSAAFPGLAITFDLSNAYENQQRTDDTHPDQADEQLEDTVSAMPVMPRTTDEQFPGLDKGQPTVQPQILSADSSLQVSVDSPDADLDMASAPTMVLPSRKRSGDAAGLNDGAEEGRSKSRRIRARDSNVDPGDNRQAIIDANTRWEYEQQLNEFQAADDWMFETVGNLFEKIGVIRFDAARYVRQEMTASGDSKTLTDSTTAMHDLRNARADIQSFLDKYSEQQAHILLHGGESLDLNQHNLLGVGGMFATGAASKSTTKPLQLPNDGVRKFLRSVNQTFTLTQDVAVNFVEALLRPGVLASDCSTYLQFLWPEDLKTMVVRVLVNFDDSIYENFSLKLNDWRRCRSEGNEEQIHHGLAELIEGVFELHLDIYSLIKQPNSGVEEEIVFAQGNRLQRWSGLARDVMHLRAASDELLSFGDSLNLRFLWATAFHLSVSTDVSQDHVIGCLNDLRSVLTATENVPLQLQNNAVMPELSLSALEREISKLTTKDFFLKVTNQDLQDPAGVIESLEPLLEALDLDKDDISHGDPEEPTLTVAPELIRFLDDSNIAVRLLLWQRLRDAYVSIEYDPMVVRCHLRMIRIVLDELKSPDMAGMPQAERQGLTLKHLRLLQDMLKKLFDIVQNSKNALDCVDEALLKTAIGNFAEILQLLQVFNVVEDSMRVGQAHPPMQSNGLPVHSFQMVNKAIHEMQIRLWIILYAFLKEAVLQNQDQYPTPLEDRFDFLRTVHRNLGIRGICGVLNRVFVRMLKDEFFQMTHIDGCDSEQAQVLYDLHRLNCFLDPSYELIEHKCVADAFVDRSVAMQAVDILLMQADKLPVKELVKHPLKDTIDKVHGSLPRKKPTEAILRNREVYRSFLRSPILPLDIFNCMKGEGNQLPTTPIPKDDAILAAKGWYFLMGHMALTKFRSQKRTGPTPTEDLDIAIAFFMQDLEYTGENWETWFRLAQAFDTKIEENVVWSAEKLNNDMTAVIALQKQTIHCYIMATALAHRSADFSFETSSKMTDLYYDFANRLYSSARKPFDMQAFRVDEVDRFISISTGVKKQVAFVPLRVYAAVKVANTLFQRALPGKPDNWMVHHMIGKCLWKMHSASEALHPHEQSPPAHRVLRACRRALELLPDKEKKESRDSKKEPVLEPHYKLVSVVHKLLTKTRTITLQDAKEALDDVPHARKETFPQSLDEWTNYVLAVLRNLRTADKSNWYHRMIYRSAKIIYERPGTAGDPISDDLNVNAVAAKHELTQQMFTKTMVLQVWRPETERPGRHFVYTAEYTRFFVQILKQLRDRQSLEQLARRVRRRPHDVFEHPLVWQDMCVAYLQLLREYAGLPEGLETSIFSNIAHEEFLARKDLLEKWMQAQEPGSSPALDVLREVQELKKINQSLMKTGAIDDLIGDSYAHIFNTVGKQLWEDDRRAKQAEEARKEAEKPLVVSPPRNPMMSLTHLMNIDGDAGSAAQPKAEPPKDTAPLETAPVRRKIGVGRREIRACAESCFQKSKVQQPNDQQALSKAFASAPRVQVLIERRQPSLPGEASVENSAPGSIHDSADDESELSELEEADDEADGDVVAPGDEETTHRPLFPNLATISGGTAREEDEQDEDIADDESDEARDDTQPQDREEDDVEGPAAAV